MITLFMKIISVAALSCLIIVSAMLMFGITGCSSEHETGANDLTINQCVSSGAAYRFSFHQTSGDCGTLPETTVMTSQDGKVQIPASCIAGPNSRYDNCDVYLDTTCNLTTDQGVPFTMTERGKVSWSPDGATGNGSITIMIKNECISTYTITANRL